jgi:hypothetical protein
VFPKKLALQHGVAFGPELPPSERVPSLPFLPASTVCSAWCVSGLLHPETDPGVRHVSGSLVLLRLLVAWHRSRSALAAIGPGGLSGTVSEDPLEPSPAVKQSMCLVGWSRSGVH